MGGGATHDAAANAAAVCSLNIGAAVALHPVWRATQPKVPIFYGTGSSDTSVPPNHVLRAYQRTLSGVAKVFAEITGAEHGEPYDGPDRWLPYTVAFFECHLQQRAFSCEKVDGTSTEEPCSLCTCPSYIPTTGCRHAHEPPFEAHMLF